MFESKACEACGVLMFRGEMTLYKWVRKRTCSHQCSGRLHNRIQGGGVRRGKWIDIPPDEIERRAAIVRAGGTP